MKELPVRLSLQHLVKVTSLPNSTYAALIIEFYQYMKNNDAPESHTNNCLTH